MHHDADNYENPDMFDGFRFAKMRGEEDASSIKYQMAAPDTKYLSFGLGRCVRSLLVILSSC